ncbi:MAG: class GN sortase [Alphaproteobacteria bacterium]
MFCALLSRAKRCVQPSSYYAVAVAALLVVGGVVLVGKGVYIHAKAMVAQYLLSEAFAESLNSGRPVKPWSWADTWPVARLEMPRIKASTIVLKGGSGQAMAFGPGLLENTAQPGAPGTSVIAAHRDTHFAFLRDARIGDEIRITRTDGAVIWFRITEMAVVRWDASGIDADAAGNWLVLSTCWPFDAVTPGDMRYVVRARMVGRQMVRRRPNSTAAKELAAKTHALSL